MATVKNVPTASLERPLTIIAQDPSILASDGGVLTTQVSIPAERLEAGPWGHRIQVIDYDASSKSYYAPWDHEKQDVFVDPYAGKNDAERLLGDPKFHAQNVYAIAMRILARFEFAFGRRVDWSFQSHQLKIAPHAFRDANAYYEGRSQSLQFGYFLNRAEDGYVFTCLSHDVVAHETTHAILDGLQSRYVYRSSPDQAAFHEAFSDVVALLSVFALTEVVSILIGSGSQVSDGVRGASTIRMDDVSIESMRNSLLTSLAEQFGDELSSGRGSPLRQSLLIRPSTTYLHEEEFQEPHRRGEILVAAVMNAFLHVFDRRVRSLDASGSGILNRERVVEEAAKTADHLLTIVIRALDYCVPVHLTFGGFLSALVTSDAEIVGDDTAYGYRTQLVESFAQFGILPDARDDAGESGAWPDCSAIESRLNYNRSHFGAFQTDVQEVFRFIWENREVLNVRDDVYTRVLNVKPCLRISPEGFPLRETVVQYVQIADIEARELWRRFRVKRPTGDGLPMTPSTRVELHGGGTLVFDQYGRLKFNITTPVDGEDQSQRLAYLWQRGYFRPSERPLMVRGFAQAHRLRR